MRTSRPTNNQKFYPITDKSAKEPRMPRSAKNPPRPERQGRKNEMTYRALAHIPKRSNKGQEFYLLYSKHAGFTTQQVADYLDLHPSTVRRYESGALPVPRTVTLALRLAAGDLGAIHPDWRTFTLDRARGIIFDSGLKHGMTPGNIRYTWYAKSLVATLEAELRQLRAQLERASAPRKRPKFVVLDWQG